MKLRGISEIVENGYCAGCGLCASILGSSKVEMRLSPAGFLRPNVLGKLNDEETQNIQTICPGVHLEFPVAPVDRHPIWGPINSVRTGCSLDDEIRRTGSSGGVLSALALHLLETGQVDFVAQIAVSASDPLGNELQLSRTREDVLRAAGSRYGPSAPLVRFEELLATGQRFAFIGKPCDVAAVRQLAAIDERVGKQVRFLLSFMCAGVPSIKGTHEILKALGVDAVGLKSFRYRGDGWPGMARAVGADGRVAEMDYSKSWGTILNRHLQFRCKICPDGTGEFADVVCADAWYGKDGYPDFDERDGRSLLLSRSQAGESLIRAAMQAGAIEAASLPVEEIDRMQPYQLTRKQLVLGRLLATRLRRGWGPQYRRLGLVKAALTARPMAWLRNAIGTYRRAEGETL